MLIAIPFKSLPTKPSPKILTGECHSNKGTFSTARIPLVAGITAPSSKHTKTKMAPNPSKPPSKSTMKRATNQMKKANSTASLTNKKPSTPLSHESCPSARPASTETTKSPNHPLKLTIPTIWFSKKSESKKSTRFQEKETSQSFISRNSIPLEKWVVLIKL
jgi:hypothetical protein